MSFLSSPSYQALLRKRIVSGRRGREMGDRRDRKGGERVRKRRG